MATLSQSDAKLFHKLMDSLLFYANKKLDIIKNCNSNWVITEVENNKFEGEPK